MKQRALIYLLLFFIFTSSKEIDVNSFEAIEPLSEDYIKFWSASYISAIDHAQHVFTIKDTKLFVKTSPHYLSNNVELYLYDGTHLLGSFLLTSDHNQGSHYKIDLEKYSIILQEHLPYKLIMKGKNQRKFQTYVKKESPEIDIDLLSDVTHRAINIDCQTNINNVVEFDGLVNQGTPPFRYMWLVYTDHSKETKAYEPTYGKLDNLNEVTQINIDRPLGYVVIFAVNDYCGEYKELEIITDCGEGTDTGNTIYIQNTNINSGTNSTGN